jgi:ribose 5-phosphate isomerase B
MAEADAIVTAAAEDLARSMGVTVQRGEAPSRPRKKVALGSDHAGLERKETLKRFLLERGDIEVLDLGTTRPEPVDYPDFALAVAEAIATGRAELGILVDGAGIGSAIAANKVPGIRAAACQDVRVARNSREHNFANILTLGGRLLDEAAANEIAGAFLDTPTGEERHAARVRKILAIEKKYSR